jgi:hypothetical protein
MTTTKQNPWAFKIDYDRAIQDDEKLITRLESPALLACIADFLPEEWENVKQGYCYSAPFVILNTYHLLGLDRAILRASFFGLSADDARALCFYVFSNYDGFLGQAQPGDYARGEEIAKMWQDFRVMSEEDRVKRLKHTKTSLARHRRNKSKNSA